MNDIVQYLILELNREKAKNSISVKKYDTNSRRVMATLTSDGAKVSLKDAERAAVKAIKPDGKYIYNDCSIIGDEIAFVLTTQMINVAGDTKAELEVAWKDGSMVTTSDFIIHVYDNISTGIESQNEYTAITQIAAECTTARDEIRDLSEKVTESEAKANTSAQSAEAARTAAIEARDSANLIKADTEGFKDEAYGYMADSAASASLAQSAEEIASTSASAAANILVSIESISNEVEGYKNSASISANNASESANNASISASTATTEANRAKSEADIAEAIVGSGIATTEHLGLVKPDGETTFVDENGVISAVGGGASSWDDLTDKPFERIGNGLSVDEEGKLNAEGEALPENVVYFEGNALKDKDGNNVLPITNTQAIYDEQGNRLDNTLNNIIPKLDGHFVSSADTNYLTVLETGIYTINNYDGAIVDCPLGGLGSIVVSSPHNGYAIQTFTHQRGDVFTRNCDNGNWSDWKLITNSISDAYNPSKTYAQGEFCIYNNTLWKSLVDNNTGNTPTEGSYWHNVSVGEEVNELNNNLKASDNLQFRFATDGEGNYGYLGADDSFIPFKSGGDLYIEGGNLKNLRSSTFTLPLKCLKDPTAYWIQVGDEPGVTAGWTGFVEKTFNFNWRVMTSGSPLNNSDPVNTRKMVPSNNVTFNESSISVVGSNNGTGNNVRFYAFRSELEKPLTGVLYGKSPLVLPSDPKAQFAVICCWHTSGIASGGMQIISRDGVFTSHNTLNYTFEDDKITMPNSYSANSSYPIYYCVF